MESNGKTQRRKSVAKRVTVRFQTALGLHSNSDDGPPSGGAAAILLLDFQNEFAKKGGKLHDDVADTMSNEYPWRARECHRAHRLCSQDERHDHLLACRYEGIGDIH